MSLKWVIEPSSTCASQAAQIPKDSDEELLRLKATAKNLSYTNKWFLKLWLLGCEFSQVCLKHTLDVLAFQFLSLRTGALLVSAHPLLVLREHHCENTLLEAQSPCQCAAACPCSKNSPRSHWATKRRVARKGRNAAAISAHIWMRLHGLQLLLLPKDVQVPSNADIPVLQLILPHAFPSCFSRQIED